MSLAKPLKVGVIGPAGFGGSYLCVELLNRGHTVIGISRNPSKLGKHPRYIPRSVDIDNAPIEEIAETFKGLDVLVSEYGPHTAGVGALLYSTFFLFISHLLCLFIPSPNSKVFLNMACLILYKSHPADPHYRLVECGYLHQQR